MDSPFFPPSSSGLDSESGDAEEPREGAEDENQDQVPRGGPRGQHDRGFDGDTPGTPGGRYDDILSNQVADGALLRIQLKLNTALLSTVRPSVRVFVCHRRDISHFSHI